MYRIVHNIAIIFLVCAESLYAYTLTPHIRDKSNEIVGMLINCEFTRAYAVTDSLMGIDSVEPIYPLLNMCSLGLRDLDFDEIIDTAAFLTAYQRTIQTIDEYENIHGQTSYSQTILGFAYASHASFYLLHKKYFSAVKTGLNAIRIFREVKQADSSNYDADLILGLYAYAKGELKKRMWMVLFWYPGSRSGGIMSLETCRKKSQIASEAAKMALIDIYVLESQYTKSKNILDSLSKKYSQSRFLLWSKVKYYEAQKEYIKAAGVYGNLADLYDQADYGDYNFLVTRWKQIELLDKAGQKKEARMIARKMAGCKACYLTQRHEKICKDIESYK